MVTRAASAAGTMVRAAPALSLGVKGTPTSGETAQIWDVVTKVAVGLGIVVTAAPALGMVTMAALSLHKVAEAPQFWDMVTREALYPDILMSMAVLGRGTEAGAAPTVDTGTRAALTSDRVTGTVQPVDTLTRAALAGACGAP